MESHKLVRLVTSPPRYNASTTKHKNRRRLRSLSGTSGTPESQILPPLASIAKTSRTENGGHTSTSGTDKPRTSSSMSAASVALMTAPVRRRRNKPRRERKNAQCSPVYGELCRDSVPSKSRYQGSRLLNHNGTKGTARTHRRFCDAVRNPETSLRTDAETSWTECCFSQLKQNR